MIKIKNIYEKLKFISIFIFYAVGLLFTYATIWTAANKYFQYPSVQIIREAPAIVTFPKVLVCATAMHSKAKIKNKYPDMAKIIPALYGFNKSAVSEEMLGKLVERVASITCKNYIKIIKK